MKMSLLKELLLKKVILWRFVSLSDVASHSMNLEAPYLNSRKQILLQSLFNDIAGWKNVNNTIV